MLKKLRDLVRRLLGPSDSLDVAARANREPASPTEQDVLADLRAFIDREVAAGYTPSHEIATAAVESVSDEADWSALLPEAERMAHEALKRHLADQTTWPELTDCDRLDAAFAALETAGVISRQNFTCCGTCGTSEIWDEIDDAKRGGRLAKGYAFFHQQDTDSAVEGHGLYLNYGACEDDGAVAIGHEIVGALTAKGLSVDWDGRLERRIGVQLDWKRRSAVSSGVTLPPISN